MPCHPTRQQTTQGSRTDEIRCMHGESNDNEMVSWKRDLQNSPIRASLSLSLSLLIRDAFAFCLIGEEHPPSHAWAYTDDGCRYNPNHG
jgi:hypothetical protein